MMICKIARNEGLICIFLFACIGVIYCAFVSESSQTIQGLCTSNRFIYTVKPGETWQFKLTAESSQENVNKWYQKSKRKCRKEFKSNNGASHFYIVISNMSVPSCSEKCNCNYFEIAEPGYSEKFCGVNKEEIYLELKNDYVSIDFKHRTSMLFEVTLTFTVRRNAYILTGLPREDPHRSAHFLETPYFPNEYQSDYVSEYILQSDDERGHVVLMFLDFQIAPKSFIEVVGHNGTHPATFYGDIFRPPVFVSGQQQLSFKFEANNEFLIGFRAICFFLKDSDLQASIPYTDCGGVKKEYGGSVTLDIVGNHNYYDCLWYLSPPVLPSSTFFLSVSSLFLENIGPKSLLEFREGLNSKSTLVKSILWDNFNSSDIPTEITVSASKGLYIRFNGKLSSRSVIRLVYSTYFNGNCTDNHLLCNGRCLLSALRCDGTEHCPNGIDEEDCETTSVLRTTTTHPLLYKRKVQSQNTTVAYYLVLSFGICGFLAVILVVIFISYRLYKGIPPATETPVLPQVVSEMAEPLPIPCPRVSLYIDLPPSYEDFIRSSDSYPPPLYTRASKRNSEPFNNYRSFQHTTSFCGKDDVLRHHSVHSFDLRSLSSNGSVAVESIFSEPGCSFTHSNIDQGTGYAGHTPEQNKHLQKNSSPILKRTASLDSCLGQMVDSNNDCHIHLSITHAICPHQSPPAAQHHSLPTDYILGDIQPNQIDITVMTSLPEMRCTKTQQKMPSCKYCHRSLSVRSEILTTVKTRCHSDPSKRACCCHSLQHKN